MIIFTAQLPFEFQTALNPGLPCKCARMPSDSVGRVLLDLGPLAIFFEARYNPLPERMQPYQFPPLVHHYAPSPIASSSAAAPDLGPVDYDSSRLPVDEAPTRDARAVRRTRRSAPGSRGPSPTACEHCRRLRVKCVRPNGDAVGAEPCQRCVKRGESFYRSDSITRSS